MDAASASPLSPCPTCEATVPESDLIRVGETTVCPNCRDQYLQAMREGVGGIGTQAAQEETRNAHLKHEASLKGVGSLYFLGGILVAIAAVMVLVGLAGVGGELGAEGSGFMIGFVAIYAVLGALQLTSGVLLRRLSPNAKVPATLVAVVGLLGFPIGTLLSTYILWLIWSAKGKVVLSREYQDIIAATPHIKYKSNWLLLLVIVIAVIVLIALAVPFASQ